MNILLDTHVMLWFASGDVRPSPTTRRIVESTEHQCFVGLASLWELAIRVSIGKRSLAGGFDTRVAEAIRTLDAHLLPIEVAHVARIRALAWHHRDPFDRMLIAQALEESLPIVTADPIFGAYGVNVFV